MYIYWRWSTLTTYIERVSYIFFFFLVLFFFSLYGSKICNPKICLFGTRINLGSLLKEKQKTKLGALYFYLSFSCLKNLDIRLVDWNTKYTRWELWVRFYLGQNYNCSLSARKNKEVGGKVSSVQFSRSVMSDSLQPHGLQHPRPPVHHQLPEFTQTQIYWVSDAIQQSHHLSSSSLPTFNLS